MRNGKCDSRYVQAVGQLPESVFKTLLKVDAELQGSVMEIRMKTGKPLALWTGRKLVFVDVDGKTSSVPGYNSRYISQREVLMAVETLSGYSVHSHQEEMRYGFITAQGGHRAGLSGTAVYGGSGIKTIREITAVNLRIAREIKGCAQKLLNQTFKDGICSFLIAGPPSSGKTTLLRDTARLLSAGTLGIIYKTAVVDERGEIAAVVNGLVQNDLGFSCDVLNGYGKADGIMQAVRTLSPQFVICDEIGTAQEVKAVEQSLNCGVNVIASIHAEDAKSFFSRPQGRALAETGAFSKIAFLSPSGLGEISEIINLDRQVQKCSSYGVW
ncbi:MAG: Flp pilus assembly complex ATPase component TadA [Oscillospiraceae bacterium]|nr:Flp pilus assembly complex ATPase component TadA [Oscillospiraceae bacterium]